MVTTTDPDLAERCWSIHHCGRSRGGAWYGHALLGTNYRMTDWQAAILIVQLGRLERQMERRERAAAFLDRSLPTIDGISVPAPDPRVTRHARHLYVFRIDVERLRRTPESFAEALRAEGIPATSGYTPLHRQALFRSDEVRRITQGTVDYEALQMPVTDTACRQIIWIPQPVLLAGTGDLRDVVDAVEKVAASPPPRC